MSNTFQCGDNSTLVAYMYDECEPGECGAIAAHVALCGACAAELAALESTRVQLMAWTPPDTDLGFVVTRPPAIGASEVASEAAQPRASWFARPMPAWAQVAAAVVIFGAGLSLGVVDGTVRGTVGGTVGGTAPSAPGAAVATAPGGAASAVSASDLTALEQRLRREMAQASEAQVLARVRALIEESEQRQHRELALRTADIMRDVDSQRGADLAQIQRNFGQMEGVTSAEVREQRQLLNYLMRVSQQGQ